MQTHGFLLCCISGLALDFRFLFSPLPCLAIKKNSNKNSLFDAGWILNRTSLNQENLNLHQQRNRHSKYCKEASLPFFACSVHLTISSAKVPVSRKASPLGRTAWSDTDSKRANRSFPNENVENPRIKVPLFRFEESTVYFLEYVTQGIFLCHCSEVHLTIKRKHDNKSGRELSEAWLAWQ